MKCMDPAVPRNTFNIPVNLEPVFFKCSVSKEKTRMKWGGTRLAWNVYIHAKRWRNIAICLILSQTIVPKNAFNIRKWVHLKCSSTYIVLFCFGNSMHYFPLQIAKQSKSSNVKENKIHLYPDKTLISRSTGITNIHDVQVFCLHILSRINWFVWRTGAL